MGILNHKEMGIKKKYNKKVVLVYLKSCAWGGRQKGEGRVRILQLELELRGVGARRGEEPHRDGEKR